MIIGTKNSEKRGRNFDKWYAWRPVRLIDGRWIWLEKVSRQIEWVSGYYDAVQKLTYYRELEK